ncbi:MAG: RidA family protein [Gammaproteobacteria bacterium]|nr:RidA family protein [Gammaproteobacteria bacterium]
MILSKKTIRILKGKLQRFLCYLTVIFLPAITLGADPVDREYVIDERGELRAFSRAVATQGGRTIWLAGQTATIDASGNLLIGDFEGQTREIFNILSQRLEHFGGTLSDIVTMTVYINDVRNGDAFVEIRKEQFEEGRYPSSALITVVGFARPEIMIEIKATAVVEGD